MCTDHELALMCKQAYRTNGGHVSGWETGKMYQADGLTAVVYTRRQSNSMVIAFRGTDMQRLGNAFYNLITDIRIALGLPLNTTDSASRFVEQVRANRNPLTKLFSFLNSGEFNQLYLTGHSLGGAVAEFVGAEFNRRGKAYKVVTFESPGCAHLLTTTPSLKQFPHRDKHSRHYVSDPNLINTRHPHAGAVIHVPFKPYAPSLFSKARYYFQHIQQCLVDDYIRICLLLIIITRSCQILFGAAPFSNHSLNNIFGLSYTVLPKVGWNSNAAEFDASNSLLQTLLALMLLKLQSILLNVLTRTGQHHPIDRFVTSLNQATGKPKRYFQMESWPTAPQFLFGHLARGITWFNPISTQNHNMRTLLAPVAMEATQVAALPGYQVAGKELT